MGAVAFLDSALEHGVAGLFQLLRTACRRIRIKLLELELDTSQKYVDVLIQCLKDDTIARRAFPLYQVQIERRMKTNAAIIVRECENQSSIHIKLMLIRLK
jgi:hypothetical protein